MLQRTENALCAMFVCVVVRVARAYVCVCIVFCTCVYVCVCVHGCACCSGARVCMCLYVFLRCGRADERFELVEQRVQNNHIFAKRSFVVMLRGAATRPDLTRH